MVWVIPLIEGSRARANIRSTGSTSNTRQSVSVRANRSVRKYGEIVNAYFSTDRLYRYRLDRDLGSGQGTYVFIGKNPSKAAEVRNDNTISRVMKRAKKAGYAKFVGLNVYAYVSSDPRGLLAAGDPIGPENLSTITEVVQEADYILCGWGWAYVWPAHAAEVEKIVRASGKPVFCLGKFKDGTPFHPARKPYSVEPVPF